MNTIHSVSSTSLVRSSEAVAVRKSFSFRSWMLRVMLVMMMVVGGKVAWGQTMVTDVLNRALTGVTGTSYSNWSGKTSISSAVYAGNSAGGNNSIQLRSSNNSGIVTTTSGGNVKKVTVVWNSNTASGRTLNIYGKNTAYSSASDLYNASTQGTLLGTIVCGTSTELTISGDYAYIGMRSNSNAMYLTSISIDWETSSSNYSVLYDANGGTGTMTDGNSPYGSGATVTVLANTFTAPDGMDFNGWNTAVDGSGTYYDEEDTFTITENTTLYAQWITSGCRSLSFSSMGYTNGRVLNGTQINISSIITVTFNKASGTTAPTYYDDGTAIRAYAKNTFTISTNNSSDITSILLTFGSGDGSNNITVNTGTYSDGTWVGSASSVTFTVGGSSGHRRIASIRACTGGVTLLYDANGGTGTMIDPNNPYTSGSTVTTMTNDFTHPDDMDFNGWNTAADGSGDYYAEGASFTITANTTLYAQWVAPNDGDCQQITFSEQGYANEEVVSTVTISSSPIITATFSQGTNGSNAPKYYNSGTAIRAYGGNTFTISVSGFNLITSIRLIFGDGGDSNTITTDAGTYNSGLWRGSETSVTFTISGTSGHRRIAGIRVCTVQPTSATVTYDGNGASGEVTDDNNPYDIDATVTVLGQGNLQNPCNTFAGWNTAADGSGTSYQEDDTFIISENVTLYAQWTPTLDYTITWLANGHFISSHNFGCGSNIDVAYVPEDASVTSAMCDGSMVFVGWSETEFEKTNTPPATIITHDGFSDITVNGNKSYYAVFATEGAGAIEWHLVTSASNMREGTYIIGALRSTTASNNYYIATSSTNSGDWVVTENYVTISNGKLTNLPTGSAEFVFTGDNSGGYTISNGNNYLGYSSYANRKLSLSSSYSSTKWVINDKTGSLNTGGIYLQNVGVNGSYTISENSTAVGAIRGYASSAVYRAIYLFKKTDVATYSAYTTFCPCEYNITGIDDGDMVWAGKSTNADWNSTINWTRYNEGGYHLAAAAPTSSNNVYIIENAECEIDELPHINEDATCGNFTINGFNIDIAENKTLTINGTATFTSGVINGNVIFGSGATVSGASASSYVNGKVTKNGMSGAFTFPTGTASLYAPFEASSSTASNVSVQYAAGSEGMPDWWNHSGNLYDAGLNHASDRENWQISASASTTLSDIKLYWYTAADNYHSFEEDASDLNSYLNVAVVKKNGFYWQNLGKASIDGSFSGAGSITAAEPLTITVGAKAAGDGEYFATFASSNGGAVVLPIELTSFTATCNGRSSLVEWTTATEKNNDFFVLERSHDAVNFKEIARIAGAGNSIEPINYAYTDYGARGGDNYYRLVQVDYDGTSTASEIIVANCLGTDGEPEVLAYPNPFNDDLTLRFENFGNIQATVEVYDMLGRMVHTQKVNCSQNDYEVVLRLAGLSDGTYNVRISTADFVINRKVVKE